MAVQELEGTVEDLEHARSAGQCRVCLADEFNVVMVACGHVLCASCAQEVQQRCPFCRKPSPVRALYR